MRIRMGNGITQIINFYRSYLLKSATFFGLGKIPIAPGTFGSIAGVVCFELTSLIFGVIFYFYAKNDLTKLNKYASSMDEFTRIMSQDVFLADIIHMLKIALMIFIVLHFIALIKITIFGSIACRLHEEKHHNHDASEIIIDEVAGQYLTIFLTLPIFFEAMLRYNVGYVTIHCLHLLACFIFFRIFDIIKPWPISYIDQKMKGPFSVMLDDLVAGFLAALFIYALYLLWF